MASTEGMRTDGMRIDELARRAKVATTTIRLYTTKGLLPPPRLVGRTGYYDESHLARLRLIGRLQEEGHSLAGIGKLLETWEEGRALADLVGVEHELEALIGRSYELVLEPHELLRWLPEQVLTPRLMRRAVKLGLIVLLDDGRIWVPDERFLRTGAALAEMGVPASAILDEWEALVAQTDEVAARFVGVFERYLLPKNWRRTLDSEATAELARTLARLRITAAEVVGAALDASIAKVAAARLSELTPESPTKP